MNEIAVGNIVSGVVVAFFAVSRAVVKARQVNPKSSIKSVEGWLAIGSIVLIQLQNLIAALSTGN